MTKLTGEWIAQGLIAIVVFFNLDAAFSFMFRPDLYAQGFEISGIPGRAVTQGMGLLFLMWNVPYLFALAKPIKNFTSLVEAVLMQAIGVIGETILLLNLPGSHPTITSSTERFIVFDGGGLVLLIIALVITRQIRSSRKTELLPEQLEQ
jgi:hypothetical protein